MKSRHPVFWIRDYWDKSINPSIKWSLTQCIIAEDMICIGSTIEEPLSEVTKVEVSKGGYRFFYDEVRVEFVNRIIYLAPVNPLDPNAILENRGEVRALIEIIEASKKNLDITTSCNPYHRELIYENRDKEISKREWDPYA